MLVSREFAGFCATGKSSGSISLTRPYSYKASPYISTIEFEHFDHTVWSYSTVIQLGHTARPHRRRELAAWHKLLEDKNLRAREINLWNSRPPKFIIQIFIKRLQIKSLEYKKRAKHSEMTKQLPSCSAPNCDLHFYETSRHTLGSIDQLDQSLSLIYLWQVLCVVYQYFQPRWLRTARVAAEFR